MTDPALPTLSIREVRRRAFLWPVMALAAGWLLLYLPRLRDSPGWYGDETGTLLMGRELLKGNTSIGAFLLTYWHPYYPYQPGYSWVAGLCSALTGGDILGARFMNACCALIIAALLYYGGRRPMGVIPAWIGAMAFLTYQQTIVHFRWVYPHNGLALGMTITIVALLARSSPRKDWAAGAGLAIGALSHPLFIHGAIAAFLCRLKKPSAWVRLATPPAAALGAIFLFITWTYWPRPWLAQDLASLAAYYGSSSRAGASASGALSNFARFYLQDLFHILALAGLLLCMRRRLYPIAVCGVVISVLLLQNRQNLTVFYYQALVLLPILALGLAGGLSAVARVVRLRAGRRSARAILFGAALLPAMQFVHALPEVWRGRLLPRNQPWVTQSNPEVETAAQWLNERTGAGDLVIANTNLAWLLKARTADFIQATLWSGFATEYFPNGVDRERFRYSPALREAKFAVIGDIDRLYTFGLPNILTYAESEGMQQWPVVWSSNHYIILANPRMIPKGP